MKRITFHLSGVKPYMQENKKYNKETGKVDYTKKKIIVNTISEELATEAEGMAYMGDYLANNKGVKVTKYYFTNVR